MLWLSVFAFQVNVTLLTDGGQSVTQYTVSVHVCGCMTMSNTCTHTPYIAYIGYLVGICNIYSTVGRSIADTYDRGVILLRHEAPR